MDNIRYGNLQATDEECIEASKLSNAHNFISRLPEDGIPWHGRLPVTFVFSVNIKKPDVV